MSPGRWEGGRCRRYDGLEAWQEVEWNSDLKPKHVEPRKCQVPWLHRQLATGYQVLDWTQNCSHVQNQFEHQYMWSKQQCKFRHMGCLELSLCVKGISQGQKMQCRCFSANALSLSLSLSLSLLFLSRALSLSAHTYTHITHMHVCMNQSCRTRENVLII